MGLNLRYIFLIGFILLVANLAFAQNDSLWFLTRGGQNADESWGVDVDSQGNIYWGTHQTVPGPWSDVYLYKLSPNGSVIWQTRWGGEWNEQVYIVTVKEPYVYVGGSKWRGLNLDSIDMFIAAFNVSNGDSVWSYVWDQGYGYDEIDGLVVESNAIYIAGWTTGQNTQNDIAVLKLSLSGQLIWSQTWGSSLWDEANGQIRVDNQNIYVAGRYNAPNALIGGDAVLVAFSKSIGAYQWHRTWGGNGLDDALGMTGDGTSLYVVGLTNSFGNGSQIFLLKYDHAGNLVWDTLWGGTGSEAARTLAITQDGYILVAGKTDSYGAGQNDIALVKFNNSGGLVWYRIWGGTGMDESHGIATGGNFAYIAGETNSYGAGNLDGILIKVNGSTGQFPSAVYEEPIKPLCSNLIFDCPNPVRSNVTIQFSLSQKSHVTLKVFDILGQEKATLCSGILNAGDHSAVFDFKKLPDGIYFYLLKTEQFVQTKKVILVK